MDMLPIFLKLTGRRCLLVGAGNVALEKIGSLLKTGLRLTVVAPEGRPEVREFATRESSHGFSADSSNPTSMETFSSSPRPILRQ
jgi:siroheme synthase (precorrin-2 oxidase/ferrochelatase)